MNDEIYRKLVDLYAGDELSEELVAELDSKAMQDPEMAHDMYTLKRTIELLRQADDVCLTEEASQRILTKMRTKGAVVEQNSPDPAHLQFHLPMQG